MSYRGAIAISSPPADDIGPAVALAGALVDASTAVPLSDQQALGVALVIDVSGSMRDGALIERVLEAARAFVEGKAAADQVAIVTFSGEVRLVQDLTNDEDVLLEALESQPLADDTSLYDAIVRAAALFEDSQLQPNVVVFSDGGDTTSVATAERAEAAVRNVGGAIFALGVENRAFPVLQQMADATGGTAAVASDPAGVVDLFDGVQATLDYRRGYPPTVNDAAQAEICRQVLAELVGPDQVQTDARPSMGAGDFAFMLREKPGCYVWIGNGLAEGGCMLHNPRYDFNDDILTLGATYWVRLAEKLLQPR